MIATAVRLMGEALQQLQRWHAAPGEGAQPSPSPEDLTVRKVRREAADMVFLSSARQEPAGDDGAAGEEIASCPHGRLPPEFRKQTEAANFGGKPP